MTLKVYTAGWVPKTAEEIKTTTTWRADLPALRNVEWMCPRPPPGACAANRGKPDYFLPSDLHMIGKSDVMLAKFETRPDRPQFGTAAEVGYAFGIRKPIIVAYGDEPTLLRYTFAIQLAQSRVASLEEAVDIIRFMADSLD